MRIAMMQTKPNTGSVFDALDHLDRVAAEAAATGVELLITPEMFLSGYNISHDKLHAAVEVVASDTRGALSDLAVAHGLHLVVGLPDVTASGGVANAAWLIDDTGELRLRYHKTHLYGDLDKQLFEPGQSLSPIVTLQTSEGVSVRVSLAICYDIEFPELVRCAALAGSEIILCPTANMVPYFDVGTRTVPKRAEENGVSIAYANYCGTENGLTYCGGSIIAAPWGSALVNGTRTEPGLLIADVPGRRPDNVAPPVAYLRDRRPDLYAALTQPVRPGSEADGDDNLA